MYIYRPFLGVFLVIDGQGDGSEWSNTGILTDDVKENDSLGMQNKIFSSSTKYDGHFLMTRFYQDSVVSSGKNADS
jgi:hypothetical protein